MPIDTSCPNCHTKYTLADNQLDKTVRCRTCQRPFLVSEDVPPGETYKRPGSGERPRLRDADRRRDDDPDYDDRDRDSDDRRRDRDRPRADDPRDRARRRARGGVPAVVWLMIAGGATVVVLTVALVLIFALGLFGGGRVTVANYNRIQTGMNEAEVIAILGQPHQVDNSWSMPQGGFQIKVLGWRSGGNIINVGVLNGKVFSKAGKFGGVEMKQQGL